jgi:23S rRNA U2552 (ribose-2'-O)-methylase RlmE/FtsJ
VQSVLVADALALAVEFLAPGGTFVTKVTSGTLQMLLLHHITITNRVTNLVVACQHHQQ